MLVLSRSLSLSVHCVQVAGRVNRRRAEITEEIAPSALDHDASPRPSDPGAICHLVLPATSHPVLRAPGLLQDKQWKSPGLEGGEPGGGGMLLFTRDGRRGAGSAQSLSRPPSADSLPWKCPQVPGPGPQQKPGLTESAEVQSPTRAAGPLLRLLLGPGLAAGRLLDSGWGGPAS